MTPHRTNELAYWITEREAMRIRKAHHFEDDGGPPWKYGWSDDKNMGTVRYCNVRREEDKVTRWIATHWRDPNWDKPGLTLAMVMARMINWPDTLAMMALPNPGNLDNMRDFMKKIEGKKWTSAYTISTCGRKMAKEDYVFDHVLRQVAAKLPDDLVRKTLAETHYQLMTVDGLGSFLAAQVVADLKNTPGHVLQEAPDWWTWAAHGPGSLRGLSMYFGYNIPPKLFDRHIKLAYQEVMPLVEDKVGKLHMQDFQNCLCEFSKYIRVKEGGHVRNKYSAG